jgi:hypothetical protein
MTVEVVVTEGVHMAVAQSGMFVQVFSRSPDSFWTYLMFKRSGGSTYREKAISTDSFEKVLAAMCEWSRRMPAVRKTMFINQEAADVLLPALSQPIVEYHVHELAPAVMS